jgi:hypothetical protein
VTLTLTGQYLGRITIKATGSWFYGVGAKAKNASTETKWEVWNDELRNLPSCLKQQVEEKALKQK